MADKRARLSGPMGTAERMAVRPSSAAHQAHLGSWLIESRQTGLPWWQFQLGVIHLRPIPGTPPPRLRFPEATHEVMLMAYAPEQRITADGRRRGQMLQPLNFVAQFVATDDVAEALGENLVRRCIHGDLHLEPVPGVATVALAAAGQAPRLADTRHRWIGSIRDYLDGYGGGGRVE